MFIYLFITFVYPRYTSIPTPKLPVKRPWLADKTPACLGVAEPRRACRDESQTRLDELRKIR
jgi:hypothetical protein